MKKTICTFLLALSTIVTQAQIRAVKSSAGFQHKDHDMFGWQVIQNAQTAFVAAPHEDGTFHNEGAVYIYHLNESLLQYHAKLTLPNPTAFALFGNMIATDGDFLIVTSGNVVSTTFGKGMVHIYKRADSLWTLVNTLTETALPGIPGSIAISGNQLAIGCPVSTMAYPHGFIQLVELGANGNILQNQTLTVSNLELHQTIGQEVAIEDHILAFSSLTATGDSKSSGMVWVYEKVNNGWNSLYQINHTDAKDYDYFGSSLALKYPYLAVGAPRQSAEGRHTGAVYIYSLRKLNYSLESKLIPEGRSEDYDYFGMSVSMDDDCIAIGSNGDDMAAVNAGAVYLYKRIGNNWLFNQKLIGTHSNEHASFGTNVSLQDHRLIVSSHLEETDSAENHGAIYYFPNTRVFTGSNEPIGQNASPLVYPNPIVSSFEIFEDRKAGLLGMKIMNAAGQILVEYTDASSWNKPIPAHSWKSGVYVISLRYANGEVHQQLIKP